jgi:hypothetical protein
MSTPRSIFSRGAVLKRTSFAVIALFPPLRRLSRSVRIALDDAALDSLLASPLPAGLIAGGQIPPVAIGMY